MIRSATNFSNINLETKMRKLNEQQEYSKALALFDQVNKFESPTDRILVQALNACAQLKSLERGRRIHRQLDDRSLNNDYIRSTLIHLYSAFPFLIIVIRRICLIVLQCGRDFPCSEDELNGRVWSDDER